MDGLQFNALIEDDHLSAAFLDAQNKSQDPTAIFDMALKAECDSGPGHVCYFGPIATEFFRDALGLGCMITSTDELSMTGRLSKPLAVVHHGQHWVPMWSKSVFGPFQSRPTLPLHCYDLYVERYGPVAGKVHAYVDCTCMAAGDCAIHSLLILSDLQRKSREPPEGERFGEWTLAEQAIWALQQPPRVKFMKWGRGDGAWWAIKRTGAKIAKAPSAQKACQLFLQRQEVEPDI